MLRAYQIENEYGRTYFSYSETINVGGQDRKVDILKMGRVALVYQSPDGVETGMWNVNTEQWEPLDDSYKSAVRDGIRMANQQLTVDMLLLPVMVREAGR